MDFLTPEDLPAPAGYSHVVITDPGARLIVTSGQIGITADGTVEAGWEAQTRQTFINLGVALAAAGATWSDVVKLTYFVVSTTELPLIRSVRDEFVDVAHPPASSLVQVAGLFRPDVLIEVEATAAIY
ncbi:Enamine deaminase RidA, house cleaning of reactive enamine intermediates, YjgF/YER057c/UK114 family [Nocardioides sp. YR527]|uniref:RidA family protein n=1 Tax=Nocardioides sp. YR527 TaxID=1881028 RepID=UPI00087F5F48|nr:RidA family protein [Nocardioides sp. YR527]SDK81915.1 Enamine deaminase RidA, house cleaning of reactive enamine intermediates, YjgF/YER057c/UK114 family [Nocardioides sp. YR527]